MPSTIMGTCTSTSEKIRVCVKIDAVWHEIFGTSESGGSPTAMTPLLRTLVHNLRKTRERDEYVSPGSSWSNISCLTSHLPLVTLAPDLSGGVNLVLRR